MDDVTKRLIDAALAYAGGRADDPRLRDQAREFRDAVDAYRKANRPLMERLADLKAGAVVRSTMHPPMRTILFNFPEGRQYVYANEARMSLGDYAFVDEIVSEGPDQ